MRTGLYQKSNLLRGAEPEIGKKRAETGALNTPPKDWNCRNFRPENKTGLPNSPKYQRFSLTWKNQPRDHTAWLTTQSLANRSLSEIPCYAGVCREYFVICREIGRGTNEKHSISQMITTKFPMQASREFCCTEQGIWQLVQGIFTITVSPARTQCGGCDRKLIVREGLPAVSPGNRAFAVVCAMRHI
jgi:hypothetical protein